MKLTNLSEKVIGVGTVTVLPGETKEVPADFETSPILEVYKKIGLVSLSGTSTKKAETVQVEKAVVESETSEEDAKKAKLETVKSGTDEEVAAIAKELGINPADCKDQADVRKKVKAALNK